MLAKVGRYCSAHYVDYVDYEDYVVCRTGQDRTGQERGGYASSLDTYPPLPTYLPKAEKKRNKLSSQAPSTTINIGAMQNKFILV